MVDKSLNITLFGGGNVATHLAKNFLKLPGYRLQQIYNRHLSSIKIFENLTEIIDDLSKLKPADLFILALKDDVIVPFSKKLKDFNVLTVHTSGSIPMDALQTRRKGVFYPFQTFSKDKLALEFSNIPILIEAENELDLDLLKNLAKSLSNKVEVVNSGQRKAIHIAGVFAANFTNYMYRQAADILHDNDLSFDLIKPLIMETARKVQNLPPAQAQTGPASRGDIETIKNHLEFLKQRPQYNLYKYLSELILEDYGWKNNTDDK